MSFTGWQLRPLGQCAKFLSGGTPSKSRTEFWEGDVPWVSSGEMAQTRVYDTLLHLSEEGVREGSRLVPANTVLAVVRGMSLAKQFRVAITRREVAFNQDLKAFACTPEVDSEFLFYALLARREDIRGLATEASHGTKKLETDILSAVEIPLPQLSIQRRIVDAISAYDDFIENNCRRIRLLEQAARLLYKEWFVYLRFPGHEHVSVIDGVPDRWDRKLVVEVCQTVGGGTPSTKKPEYWEDGHIPWVIPTDVTRNDCTALLGSEKRITQAGLQSSSAKMVPPETILMTSRASVGFFAMMEQEVCTNQGFINIIPNNDETRMYMLYNLMHRVEEIRSHAGGSTYKEISKGRFRNLTIIMPPLALCHEFNEIAYLLLQQTRSLLKQNANLVRARDLLLPRLMNGGISI